MKKQHTALLSLFAAGTFAQADLLGGEIALGFFDHSPSGFSSYEEAVQGTATQADLEDMLGFENASDFTAKAHFEHPFPFVPDVRAAYTKLTHEGDGSVDGFSWGDIANHTGKINSALGVEMVDLTLYYSLPIPLVDISAGLTGRYISGDTDITAENAGLTGRYISGDTDITAENAGKDDVTFDAFIPMLYAKAGVSLPLTGLSARIETNYIGFDGQSFYDIEAGIRYNVFLGFGIEAGYKTYHIESDDLSDGLNTDIDISGPYAQVVWDF